MQSVLASMPMHRRLDHRYHPLARFQCIVQHCQIPRLKDVQRQPRARQKQRARQGKDRYDFEDNLIQAIIIRLLTPKGELSRLGHPDYGSRLHEMVGSTNTENTRNLVKLRIIESLNQEPRIESIEEVIVEPSIQRRSSIDVYIRVKPINQADSINFGPLNLDLES